MAKKTKVGYQGSQFDPEDQGYRSRVKKVEGYSPIKEHSGSKYVRTIRQCSGSAAVEVDVYEVLLAFGVTCPARQHAIKKLLAAGLREKGDQLKDLTEARDAVSRAIEIQSRV